MLSAERYDFVLTAVREEGSFWFRATGLGACAASGTEGLAVIQYVTPGNNSATSGDLHSTDTVIVEPEKTPAPEIKGKVRSQITHLNCMAFPPYGELLPFSHLRCFVSLGTHSVVISTKYFLSQK